MKKIFAIVSVVMLSTVPCFADEGETVAPPVQEAVQAAPAAQAAAPVSQGPASRRTLREAALRTADTEVVTGKVVCVAPSDLTRPRATLTIADANGNEIMFEMKALAVIYTRGGELLSLDELQGGQDVEVAYRILTCGSREATSVKVLH